MSVTDKLVHEFELYWGDHYEKEEKRRALTCSHCGRENAFPSKYLNAPTASRRQTHFKWPRFCRDPRHPFLHALNRHMDQKIRSSGD
eukprot:7092773-Karenia_brevis.AAC.1